MEICPLCLNSVSQLKTNSHVIPRFLIVETKINGKNVVFGKENIKERNQTDVKGDYVCEACEKKFTADDTFAAQFFENPKYVTNRVVFPAKPPNGKESGYEEYDLNCFVPLKLFVMSIVLRYHLYLKKYEGRDLLGVHFEDIRLIYLGGVFIPNTYPTCMLRYFTFKGLGYPTKEKNEDLESIFILIKSYRLWMYLDPHRYEKPFEDFIMSRTILRAMLVDNKGSKLESDIFEVIEKNKNKKNVE